MKTRVARRLSGWFLRRADAVVFPAVPVRTLFDDLPTLASPQVLPPSVDLAPWCAARDNMPATHRGGAHIVYLGRLEPRKGLETLLDAWPLIAAALPEAQLLIAGSGSLQTKVIAMSRASPRLHHIPAPDDAKARQIVAASDFFVAPAGFGESFGLVLIEALAAGALPLAAANAGFASVLTGPGTDLLFAIDDRHDLATRLIALARDPERSARLRSWGAGHAQGFDITTQGPRFVDLYRRVLAQTAP